MRPTRPPLWATTLVIFAGIFVACETERIVEVPVEVVKEVVVAVERVVEVVKEVPVETVVVREVIREMPVEVVVTPTPPTEPLELARAFLAELNAHNVGALLKLLDD